MLMTITYNGENTPDLGYILHKNPYHPQAFSLSTGKAYVFFPEVSPSRTTVALLLDLDTLSVTRPGAPIVNDRAYVSSSLMSTALAKIFGTAMSGRADSHQGLSDTILDLSATVVMLPCRTERKLLNRVFEPLGYEVSYESYVCDELFPAWGGPTYINLTIHGKQRLRDLLRHLAVLIPVFDSQKQYWIGADEVDKVFRLGEEWLPSHPQSAFIHARYLAYRQSLLSHPLDTPGESQEEAEAPEGRIRLTALRYAGVVDALKRAGATSVIDLGCGEGNLLKLLLQDRQFARLAGVDASAGMVEAAGRRLGLEEPGDAQQMVSGRVKLFQGALSYRDQRFSGYDAACLIEVVEYLDPARLGGVERVIFEFAHPKTVILTTPNADYNIHYGLSPGTWRHKDHRFEWTKAQFRDWAQTVGEKFGYTVSILDIGPGDERQIAPTQMGVFTCV